MSSAAERDKVPFNGRVPFPLDSLSAIPWVSVQDGGHRQLRQENGWNRLSTHFQRRFQLPGHDCRDCWSDVRSCGRPAWASSVTQRQQMSPGPNALYPAVAPLPHRCLHLFIVLHPWLTARVSEAVPDCIRDVPSASGRGSWMATSVLTLYLPRVIFGGHCCPERCLGATVRQGVRQWRLRKDFINLLQSGVRNALQQLVVFGFQFPSVGGSLLMFLATMLKNDKNNISNYNIHVFVAL